MPDAPYDQVKDQLLDAALLHVPFDGWTEATFMAAIAESGVETGLARSICPRGAVDLAVAFHKRGDDAMVKRLKAADLGEMRFRDKIATAVRYRIEAIEDKEAVRRGTTLFALPQYAGDGAKLIWGTCDLIWDMLGDTSDDINWYTKRATLSGVYGSTVLYWLGDDSVDHQSTWDFLDRRIGDVMQFEKIKAQINDNPLLKRVFAGPNWVLSKVKAPSRMPRVDLPGSWTGPN
ncbi:COQ9 family protein [Pseudaestuariivita rosea]|uniref:COQ9 family protein n=1 Tax=Pseudaestuariivita rosea TaxID=2763263 RepID=UPI001ABA0D1C|nr:COQ9 family protein [Pseudaestuariivita rosea]